MKIVKTVAVVAFQSATVLLVKHLAKSDHINGVYGLPAGRNKEGESDIMAAERELGEETGRKTTINNLIFLPTIYEADIPRKNDVPLRMTMKVFYCSKHGGELKESSETKPEWVEISKLSSINLLPNVLNAINEAIRIHS